MDFGRPWTMRTHLSGYFYCFFIGYKETSLEVTVKADGDMLLGDGAVLKKLRGKSLRTFLQEAYRASLEIAAR